MDRNLNGIFFKAAMGKAAMVKKNLIISSEKDLFHFSEGLSKENPILIEIER